MCTRTKRTKSTILPAPSYAASTFLGLHKPNDSRPLKRHLENIKEVSNTKRRKNDSRHKEVRAKDDGKRLDFKALQQALENKVVLPFRLCDFLNDKHKGTTDSIRVQGGTTYKPLKDTKTRLLAKDGPRLVVDLDDRIILFYCPHFLGTGLQLELNKLLANLVHVNPPVKDGTTPDRRTAKSSRVAKKPTPFAKENRLTEKENLNTGGDTSSRAARYKGRELAKEGAPLGDRQELESAGTAVMDEACQSEDEQINAADIADRTEPSSPGVEVSQLWRSKLEPSSYLWSPAWYQSAQENTKPIQVSSGMGVALTDASREATVQLLEAKRLLDDRLKVILEFLHPELARIMAELKQKVLSETGTGPSQVWEHGWTSAFPNYAIAFNRQTGAHRDSKGIENAMDFLLLLGRFAGGRLVFPDLDLKLEWKPSFFCAFDGYSFTHRVERWEGRQRTCLISFCHSAGFRGQGIDHALSMPTAASVGERVSKAKNEWAEERRTRYEESCK